MADEQATGEDAKGFQWERDLAEEIEAGLRESNEISIRPTTLEERREFSRLTQLGYIRFSCDSRIDSLPWFYFGKRLLADIIRLEARNSSLFQRLDETDTKRGKAERALERTKKKPQP